MVLKVSSQNKFSSWVTEPIVMDMQKETYPLLKEETSCSLE